MTLPAPPRDDRGPEMFARYAYAPNALGFCGPPLGATLRDGSIEDVRLAATQFSGAWPYLQVLARMTGISDPLDYRLVESYWLGGGVGGSVRSAAGGRRSLGGRETGIVFSRSARAAKKSCSGCGGCFR